MKVLSLFDGASCAQIALRKIGITPEDYFSSEIDDYAMKITNKNFPRTKQIGDITQIRNEDLPKNIDLLIGGSPCQGLSTANNDGKGLEDERSALFWRYVEILNIVKPRYFVLENVRPRFAKDETAMTNAMGVHPVMLDAQTVSAQRRRRLFWTNIPNVKKPQIVPSRIYPDNKIGLVIADILEPDAQRRIVNVAPERIIKTSYGIRWNQFQNGAQSRKAVDTNKKGFTVDTGINRKYGYNVVQGSNYGLQGNQVFDESNKHNALIVKNTSRDAMIVRKKGGYDENPQGQNAKSVDQKSDPLFAERTRQKANIVIDHNSQTNRAIAIGNKFPTVKASRPEQAGKILIDHNSQQSRAFHLDGKSPCLPAHRTQTRAKIIHDLRIEQLTWTEIERLQGMLDGYTDLGEDNRVEQRGRSIGNGFQCDIVAHLLSFMLGNPKPVERRFEILIGEQILLF